MTWYKIKLLFSHKVTSDSLWSHGQQHTRLPCPSWSPGVTQTDGHWISDANQVSHPLSSLFLPALNISQTQGLFYESALCIRWPKFWSFSFTISSSNEYSGLISFRFDWFELLAVQGPLKSLLQHHNSKASFFSTQPSLWSKSHNLIWLIQKP